MEKSTIRTIQTLASISSSPMFRFTETGVLVNFICTSPSKRSDLRKSNVINKDGDITIFVD